MNEGAGEEGRFHSVSSAWQLFEAAIGADGDLDALAAAHVARRVRDKLTREDRIAAHVAVELVRGLAGEAVRQAEWRGRGRGEGERLEREW